LPLYQENIELPSEDTDCQWQLSLW